MKFMKALALAAMASGAVFVVGWQVHAETNRVKFPENLDRLVHYTTVRRGNVTEHIMTTLEVMEAVKSGRRSTGGISRNRPPVSSSTASRSPASTFSSPTTPDNGFNAENSEPAQLPR